MNLLKSLPSCYLEKIVIGKKRHTDATLKIIKLYSDTSATFFTMV